MKQKIIPGRLKHPHGPRFKLSANGDRRRGGSTSGCRRVGDLRGLGLLLLQLQLQLDPEPVPVRQQLTHQLPVRLFNTLKSLNLIQVLKKIESNEIDRLSFGSAFMLILIRFPTFQDRQKPGKIWYKYIRI
jgi:hypothetical protein